MLHTSLSTKWLILVLVFAVLSLSACGSAAPASSPPPTPSRGAPPTLLSTQPAIGGNTQPAWWPKELAMPQGTVFKSDVQRNAFWENADPNRDGIAAALLNEGKRTDYNVYDLKDDIGHTLYFFKSDRAYGRHTPIPNHGQ
jgi:hypothetical protein